MSGPSPPRLRPGPPSPARARSTPSATGSSPPTPRAGQTASPLRCGVGARSVRRRGSRHPARPDAVSRHPRTGPCPRGRRTTGRTEVAAGARADRLRHRLGDRVEHRLGCLHRRPPVEEARRGFCAANIEPGRATTSIGRKWPSFGASPPPASIVMTTRAADTVDAIGQLTGPGRAAGASEKSRRAVVPSISSMTSNGISCRDAVVVHHAAADVPAVRQLLDVAAHDGLAVVVHPLDAVGNTSNP